MMPDLAEQQAAVKATGLGSPRNGMPASGGYVYRARTRRLGIEDDGEDLMPWAIITETPEQQQASVRRYNSAARQARIDASPANHRCKKCGWMLASAGHRTACARTRPAGNHSVL